MSKFRRMKGQFFGVQVREWMASIKGMHSAEIARKIAAGRMDVLIGTKAIDECQKRKLDPERIYRVLLFDDDTIEVACRA